MKYTLEYTEVPNNFYSRSQLLTREPCWHLEVKVEGAGSYTYFLNTKPEGKHLRKLLKAAKNYILSHKEYTDSYLVKNKYVK